MLVGAAAVPDEDDGPAHVTCEMAEKAQHLRASDVHPRGQRQGEGELATLGRHDQRANPGHLFMRAGAHGQRGRDAARRPRAPEHRPHQESGLIEADQVAAVAREFFYPGPVLLDPRAHAAIVALFGAWLGPLRTETTRPEQPSNVIRMVGDLEVVADEVDDPPAGPQACPVAGRFGSRPDQARQLTPLRGRQLRRAAPRPPRTKNRAGLPPMRPPPAAHRGPIPPPAVRYDTDRGPTPPPIQS